MDSFVEEALISVEDEDVFLQYTTGSTDSPRNNRITESVKQPTLTNGSPQQTQPGSNAPDVVVSTFRGKALSSCPNFPSLRAQQIKIPQHRVTVIFNEDIDWKLMFQLAEDEAKVLNERMYAAVERLLKQHNLAWTDLYEAPSHAFQEPSYCVGMIASSSICTPSAKKTSLHDCCYLLDFTGGQVAVQLPLLQENKLASQSVEAVTNGTISSEEKRPTDPSPSYSIFPGQVVLLFGHNPTGQLFNATHLYTLDMSLPRPPVHVASKEMELHLMVAAGPFTSVDVLNNLLRRWRPHALILCGPLVEEILSSDVDVTYDSQFENRLSSVVDTCSNTSISLIVVPSVSDAHHLLTFPQPGFQVPSKINSEKLQTVTNPAMLNLRGAGLSGMRIGVSTMDVLKHMGAEEVSQGSQIMDRMSRLCAHILADGSFYPLYPPKEECPIDYTMFHALVEMSEMPHILLLPSKLTPFVKNVNGTLCINPGVGRSFARVFISMNALEDGTDTVVDACAVNVCRYS